MWAVVTFGAWVWEGKADLRLMNPLSSPSIELWIDLSPPSEVENIYIKRYWQRGVREIELYIYI